MLRRCCNAGNILSPMECKEPLADFFIEYRNTCGTIFGCSIGIFVSSGILSPGKGVAAMKVSIISILVNLILTIFKIAVGKVSHSSAMISDGIHSASDVFSTLVVIIGLWMAGKNPDREHPYGHERMECVAALLLSGLLALVGMKIGLGGIQKIAAGGLEAERMPGRMALAAAILSVVVKEWMFRYTRKTARRLKSGALMADACHHRSDALSSIGALTGILGARAGFPILDSVACVVICIFIEKSAVGIFRDSMDKMIDKACDAKTVEDMRNTAMTRPGVREIDQIMTRMFGAKVYVDMEISVDDFLTLRQAHEIAEDVHEAMEKSYPQVKHCMVHVNPYENTGNHQAPARSSKL